MIGTGSRLTSLPKEQGRRVRGLVATAPLFPHAERSEGIQKAGEIVGGSFIPSLESGQAIEPETAAGGADSVGFASGRMTVMLCALVIANLCALHATARRRFRRSPSAKTTRRLPGTQINIDVRDLPPHYLPGILPSS